MFLQFDSTIHVDPVAWLALLLSGYATFETARFNRRQKSVIASQEALNKRLLAKEENEVRAGAMADLGATLIKIAKNNYRVRIFNRGKSVASNVTLDPLKCEFLDQRSIDEVFPLEVLEQHQSVELVAFVHLGTKIKQKICLRWSDDASDTREKNIDLTL